MHEENVETCFAGAPLQIDLNKCRLKVTIKNATLDKQGDIVFAIDADGFSAQATVSLE